MSASSSTDTTSTSKINKTSPTVCPNKGLTQCSNYRRFNDTTCQCECRDGCNPCNPPQVWDTKKCGCGCKEKKKCNTSYQYW